MDYGEKARTVAGMESADLVRFATESGAILGVLAARYGVSDATADLIRKDLPTEKLGDIIYLWIVKERKHDDVLTWSKEASA